MVLRVGPLDRAAFEALLPGRPALGRFVSLVRAYLGFETGFAVSPVLAGSALAPLRLGGANPMPFLGWNTWMPSPAAPAPGERDRNDAVFEAERVEAARPHGGRA